MRLHSPQFPAEILNRFVENQTATQKSVTEEMMYTKKELTRLFSKLGAREPESWAASQISEGINQLGRYLFLRQAWREVVDDNDHSWIQAQITWSASNQGEPCSGIGPALQRLVDRGADPQDITDVVRVKQYEVLFQICYLLGDPSLPEQELEDFCWGLFQVDQNGKIGEPIDGLHESVLETDPTVREMRPRNQGV
jgi:hypothetical protein